MGYFEYFIILPYPPLTTRSSFQAIDPQSDAMLSLSSNDSSNVNLRVDSKGREMEYLESPKARHIHLNCVHMNKLSVKRLG